MATILSLLVAIVTGVVEFLQVGTRIFKDGKAENQSFRPHEHRPMLEAVLHLAGGHKFMIASADSKEESMKRLFQGFQGPSGKWSAVLGWVRDSVTTLVLTCGGPGFEELLTKAKVKVSTSGGFVKVSKYMKRLFSSYRDFSFFEEKDLHIRVYRKVEEILKEGVSLTAGQVIASCDGMNFISPWMARQITGKRHRVGEVLQGTVFFRGGMAKGHFVVKHINYDLILYFPKEEIAWDSDTVFVGIINPVHGKEAHTDIQSLVNFNLWDFIYDPAREYLLDFWDKFSDLESIKAAVGYREEDDREEEHDMDRDSLTKALNKGVDVRNYPMLMTRLRRLFAKKVYGMVKDFRIPWGSRAVRRYVLPDLFAYDRNGQMDGDSCLLAGQFHVADIHPTMRGELFHAHRQPNAAGEIIYGVQANPKELEEYSKAGNAIFMSIWDIEENLAICGGGDCDDAFIIYLSESINKHLLGIPQKELKDLEHPKPFTAKGDFKTQLAMAISGAPDDGIGSYVNAIMVDKANGMYKDWYTPALATMNDSLEIIIDSFVKDGGNLSKFAAKKMAFWEDLACVPAFLYPRVPMWKREKKDLQVYKSHADKVLAQVEDLIKKYYRQSRLRDRNNCLKALEHFAKFDVDQAMSRAVRGKLKYAGSMFFRAKKANPHRNPYELWVECYEKALAPLMAKDAEAVVRVLPQLIYSGQTWFGTLSDKISEGTAEIPDKVLGHPALFDLFLEAATS